MPIPVTLVTQGGVPVELVDQTGTAFPTTGTGSLVFSDAPTLVNPVVGTQAAADNSTKAASTAYVDRDHVRVLGARGDAVVITGSTNETTAATITIPAGLMGLNGQLRVTTLWSVNNNGNAKTGRVRLGGVSGTQVMALNMASTVTYQLMQIVRNRNSAASQVFQVVTASSNFTNSSGAVGTATVNTAVAQDLVISGQLANSGDSITLEAYSVEFIPGV